MKVPFNCELTQENQSLYEQRILELIDVFFMCFSQVLADCITTKMYEYLLAYQYIDTKDEVHQKQALKKMQLSSDGFSLIAMMRNIRNFEIHSPNVLTQNLYNSFRKSITSDSIKDVTGFYLCPDKAVSFLEYQAKQLNKTADSSQRMEV